MAGRRSNWRMSVNKSYGQRFSAAMSLTKPRTKSLNKHHTRVHAENSRENERIIYKHCTRLQVIFFTAYLKLQVSRLLKNGVH